MTLKESSSSPEVFVSGEGGGVPGRKECQATGSSALTFVRPVVTCKRVIWAAASTAWSSVLASTLLSLPRPSSSAVSSPHPPLQQFPSEVMKRNTLVERSGVLFKITGQAVPVVNE